MANPFKSAWDKFKCWIGSSDTCPPIYEDPIGPDRPQPLPPTTVNPIPEFKLPTKDPPSITLPKPLFEPDGDDWKPYLDDDFAPTIPPRRLPQLPDNQTPFKTPQGESITIQEALYQRTYGKLLFKPVKEKIEITELKSASLKENVTQDQAIALERIGLWYKALENGRSPKDQHKIDTPDLTYDPITLWDCALLLIPESLRGFGGEQGAIFGNKYIHQLADILGVPSNNAYLKVENYLYKEIKIKTSEVTVNRSYPSANDFNLISASLSPLSRLFKIMGGELFANGDISLNLDSFVEEWSNDLFYQHDEDGELVLDENDQPIYQLQEIKNIDNIPDLFRWLIVASYWKLGLQHYPIEALKSMTAVPKEDEDPEMINLYSFTEFQHWQSLMLDELIGQFPIDIKIEKNHALLKRRVPIQLATADFAKHPKPEYREETPEDDIILVYPNLAEAIAEMMGSAIEQKTSQMFVQMAVFRILAESASIKKAIAEDDSMLRSIIAFLGFETKDEKGYLPLTCNPFSQSSDLHEHFDYTWLNFNKTIFKFGSKNPTLKQQLENLLTAASIIKAAHWETVDPANPKKTIKDQLKQIIKSEEDAEESRDDNWEQFLQDIEDGWINWAGIHDNVNPYNKPYSQRPRIRELGTDQEG